MKGNIFQHIPINKVKSNSFNLSHELKFSAKFGELIPIMCLEGLPGDRLKDKVEILTRMSPLLAPVMQRMDVKTYFFKVPYRLIWDNWESFITRGADGTADPVWPHFRFNNTEIEDELTPGSLCDYMGLPTYENYGTSGIVNADKTIEFSSLPFRAYQLIYNEYFRDQNLEDEIPIPKTDGTEQSPYNLLTMRTKAWAKDYFTSALPWTQRGGDVYLPMTGEPDVYYKPGSATLVNNASNDSTPLSGNVSTNNNGLFSGSAIQEPLSLDVSDSIGVDMSNVTSATINELRRAIQLQKWLELNARGGSRYNEQILSHFGVKSSDARLQRPEFLGGGSSPLSISEVLQQSATEEGSAQGNMSGHGISVQVSHAFNTYCEEHCFIMGIMCILPKATYQQGLPKMWTRRTYLDYYWPEFAHLGEQEVLNQELYFDFVSETNVDNESTFGYQSRYAEYKYLPSRVAGQFRTTLAFWHLGRIFGSRPNLNKAFVHVQPAAFDRIFPVATDASEAGADKFYVQMYHNLKAVRKMPVFGVPKL